MPDFERNRLQEVRLQGGEGLSAWVLNVNYPFLSVFSITRSARWVPHSANVPRFGVPPNLLLDFATSDTQRTLLVAVGFLV